MSACQSQSHAGSSCATGPLAVRTDLAVIPDGSDAIRITETVVAKVAEMLAEEGDPALQLRIFVTGGGCAGFQYGFAFDDEVKEDDVRVERGPIKVVIDAMSARFVIRNPNAASTCGCGSSFSV
jgi:iron-sulfur cluster insertion protein